MPSRSINNSIRTPLLLLGIVEASSLFVAVHIAGVVIYGSLQDSEQLLGPLLPRALTVALVMFVALISVGLYQFHQRVILREVFVRIAVAVSVSGLVLAAIFYFLPVVAMPLAMVSLSGVIALLLLLLVRFAFVRNVDENIFRRRTLIYGAGDRAATISSLRRRADRRGFKIVGQIAAPGDTQIANMQSVLAKEKPLIETARETKAEEIVIAMDDRRGNMPVRELLDCKLHGIEVIDLVEFLERETGMIRIDLVNPGWLIFTPGFRVGALRRATERVMDVCVGTVVLLLTWPLMLLVALAVKVEDGLNAPVIYKQERVGLHGDTFEVLKFRSMRVDAERDGKPVWADENDDRITRIGKFLRKYRLDELPQSFNVLKGEMSLVGPRPERPEFVSELTERIQYYAERHTVKPGVTGWAQLRYPYGSSEEDAAAKLQYDLYYVKNQSLMLDLMILLQTMEVVLWGKGAR